MSNFAVAASKETIEKANKVMEAYYRDGDKKEDTLLRIMDVAEKESIRGTHPELDKNLQGVDKTISTLIKQINGIIAAQDLRLNEYKANLENVLIERQEALDAKINAEKKAKEVCDDAENRIGRAVEEIKRIQSETEKEIKLAVLEKEQAYMEAEAAKKLSEETSRSYALLSGQMAKIEEEMRYMSSETMRYKEEVIVLRKEHKESLNIISKLQAELQDSMQKYVDAAEKAMMTERELRDQIQKQESTIFTLRQGKMQ